MTLRKPTRVALLPVGYQNGFGVERPREKGLWAALERWRRERHRFVRINGQKAPVIGQIGATETLVNVTHLKCSASDTAVFDLDPLFARGVVREYR